MRAQYPAVLSLFVVFGCGGTPAASGSGGALTTTTSSSTGGDTGGTGTTTQPETTGGTTNSGGTGGTTNTGGTGGLNGGTGGTGGTGGLTGGTGGSGGQTTSSTTTINPNMPCVWGDVCGGNFYCEAPGCGAGTCKLKPPMAGLSPTPDPVCGCDGVTYWAADVAASKGMSVASQGACAAPTPCGPGMACAPNLRCNRNVADEASCDLNATGICWGTPLSCPLDGPKARGCISGLCELKCSLIQGENPWFEDPTCQ